MPPPELPRAHLLHDLEHGWRGNGGRRLLYDLLMPPLDGTVAPKQGHGVPILVSEELDLQVMGVLGQLHEKDWGAGDLALHLGGRQGGWLLPGEAGLEQEVLQRGRKTMAGMPAVLPIFQFYLPQRHYILVVFKSNM